MQLTKEVKDILEGIHYFLVESLKNESLKGEVECQRRGLLLQLQALKEPYPFLHFKSTFDPNANIRTGSSTAFFNSVDHVPVVNGSSRMSTSSSGSTNYSTSFSNDSSTGYSGDGIIPSRDANNVSSNANQSEEFSENYEDFDDLPTPPKKMIANKKGNSPKRLQRKDSQASSGCDDEEYAVSVDPVAFRFLIAKCDHRGTLMKRSTGLIRSSKSYFGVLVGTLLYLFQKETDDRQKKVVDVIGYIIRECQDDVASKRKDFPFELVHPGKKTHTFYCSKRKDRDQWIIHLKRAESSSIYQNTKIQKSVLAKVEEAPAVDIELDESDFEVYEEVDSDTDITELQDENRSVHGSSTYAAEADGEQDNYYTVPNSIEVIENESSSSNSKSNRQPPERPPPPRRPPMPRPLPEAPDNFFSDEQASAAIDDEIYCEIDENLFEEYQSQTSESLFSDSINSVILKSSSSSLSQDIFDTINERLTPLPEVNYKDPKYDDRESYDVPSERLVPFTWKTLHQRPLPDLPPKCASRNSHCDEEDDDSEYKVPNFSYHSEDIYLSPPPNPVPISCKMKSSSYEVLKKSHSDEQINKDETEKLSSEFVTSPETDKKELKNTSLENSEEENSELGSITATDETQLEENKSSNQSSSVKSIIAMIDQKNCVNQKKSYNSFRFSKTEHPSTRTYDDSQISSSDFSSNKKKIESFQIKRSIVGLESNKALASDKNSSESKSIPNNRLKSEDNEDRKHCKSDSSNNGSYYIAKFDYVANAMEQLSFSRGDRILVRESCKEWSWWKATIKGKEGLVPKEYLKME